MLAPRLRIFFALGALTIGITRVVVGAHYPSDVAAGLLTGLWTALMAAFLFAGQNWLFRLDEAGWPRPKNIFDTPAKG
jgi:membrane-associated phospholipid phosphatase